jgi:uncharacterized protein (TIGR01777 family)
MKEDLWLRQRLFFWSGFMNIAVTGASGLIGSHLVPFLTQKGHHVTRMVRKAHAEPGEILWDPFSETLDITALEGFDAVIHLAGENIAAGRWTAERRRRIRESRIQGTRFLAQSLAKLFDPPRVFVSISAIGYYGNRGEEQLDENSDPGRGFLADLCKEWEAATAPASVRGIRVVTPRVGMLLNITGGALERMLPAFRMGIGGRIGSGKQYMSWIATGDLLEILDYAICNGSIHGPVNAVAPEPVTNREFSAALGRVLLKPTFMALPAFAARIAFGEMADELLLCSTRVSPARLDESGYKFRFPELEGALRHALESPAHAAQIQRQSR